MSDKRAFTTDPDVPRIYQIRLEGQLGRQWMDWFDGLTISHEAEGETLLTGRVADQAALYGLLRKARDLGLSLISVHRVEPGRAEVDMIQKSSVNMEKENDT